MPTGSQNLKRLIEERAEELGFVRVGFWRAAPLDHADHFDRWIADGFHGKMSYMENHRALRLDPREMHPSTRTVVALAAPYGSREIPPDADPPISRYALGDDYHDVLRGRMRRLAAFVEAEAGIELDDRPAVDSAPLLERNIAVNAGIGWLGKSAMVLDQEHGSYFFLAELLLDLELEPDDRKHPDRCGRCTRCIDACPTGAIVAPYRVDARRCISYLTIELRGPIPRSLRSAIGLRLFGCDVCQAVCPWNLKGDVASRIDELAPRPEIVALTAVDILTTEPDALSRRLRGSPVKRAGRAGLARNAAVVLGNTGDRSYAGVLAATLDDSPHAVARGHAAWALGRLGGTLASVALDVAASREEDPYVLEEIRFAQRARGSLS